MITQQHKELLEQMSKTPYGAALQAYLDEAFEELNDIQTCKDAEDLKARQKALGVIEKLFKFIRPHAAITQKTTNQYL